MPNGRRLHRKRHGRKRGGFRKSVARIARRVIRSGAETKYNLITVGDQFRGTAVPYFNRWTIGLVQGTTAFTRIGQEISVKSHSYHFRFKLNQNVGGGVGVGEVRFLIVYPREGHSDADVSNTMAAIVAGANIYAKVDPTTAIVLKDKWFFLSNPSAAFANNTTAIVPAYVTIKGRLKMRMNYLFNGVGVVDKSPTIYCLTTVPAGNDSQVGISGFLSLSFKDV